MIRIVAENILLFLLPTIVYIAYVYLTREERPGAAHVLDDAPLIWLFIAGAVLVVVTLASFGSVTAAASRAAFIRRRRSRTDASSLAISIDEISDGRRNR